MPVARQKSIYVVMGETGEYSARRDWAVLAFKTREAAEAFVLAAETWLRAHALSYDSPSATSYQDRESLSLTCPFDGALRVDYTGARYYVMPVEMAK